jgi:hypothetical protein
MSLLSGTYKLAETASNSLMRRINGLQTLVNEQCKLG